MSGLTCLVGVGEEVHEEEGEEVQRLPRDLLRRQAPHCQVPVLQVGVTGGQQRSAEVSRGQ